MPTAEQPDHENPDDEEPDSDQEVPAGEEQPDQLIPRTPNLTPPIPDIGEQITAEFRRALQPHWDLSQLTAPWESIAKRMQDQILPLLETSELVKTFNVPVINYSQEFRFPSLDQWLEPFVTQVRDVLSRIKTFELDIPREEGPDNWADLPDTFDLFQVLDLAETGIPVAWVPRASVLAELLKADDDQRLEVLLAHRSDILDDCTAVSAVVHTGTFAEKATFMDEAITAFRRDLPAAAQALAASVMDTLLREAVHEPVKRGYYSKVIAKIESTPILKLPWAATHWPVVTALTSFNGGEGPPPRAFNRHATAHTVGTVQYTLSNALIAIMLASSVLREAHHVNTTPEPNDREDD